MNTDNLVTKFDDIADYIMQKLNSPAVDDLNNKIYMACSENQKLDKNISIPNEKKELNSYHFRAIADAN